MTEAFKTPETARRAGDLAARSVQVKIVLNAAEVLALAVENGQPRVHFKMRCEDCGEFRAEISAKSAREAQVMIREHGEDGVACLLQGRLARGATEIEGVRKNV
jgi:hypothetical protein